MSADDTAPSIPLDEVIRELGLSPSDFERRVWLLFDCDTVVSAHRTQQGAEAARVAHHDRVRAEMGEKWLPRHDEQI